MRVIEQLMMRLGAFALFGVAVCFVCVMCVSVSVCVMCASCVLLFVLLASCIFECPIVTGKQIGRAHV